MNRRRRHAKSKRLRAFSGFRRAIVQSRSIKSIIRELRRLIRRCDKNGDICFVFAFKPDDARVKNIYDSAALDRAIMSVQLPDGWSSDGYIVPDDEDARSGWRFRRETLSSLLSS